MGPKSSHLAKPALGSSLQHEQIWDDKNGVYNPVMAEFSHESIVGLSMCKRNTKCLPQICKRKEKTFVCSQSHHCQSCGNSEENLYLKDFVANCQKQVFIDICNCFYIECIIIEAGIFAFFSLPRYILQNKLNYVKTFRSEVVVM